MKKFLPILIATLACAGCGEKEPDPDEVMSATLRVQQLASEASFHRLAASGKDATPANAEDYRAALSILQAGKADAAKVGASESEIRIAEMRGTSEGAKRAIEHEKWKVKNGL